MREYDKEKILNAFFEQGDGKIIFDDINWIKDLKIDGLIEFVNPSKVLVAYNTDDSIFATIRQVYLDNNKLHVGEQILPGVYFINTGDLQEDIESFNQMSSIFPDYRIKRIYFPNATIYDAP